LLGPVPSDLYSIRTIPNSIIPYILSLNMPSARSTVAIAAALVYGTSVLAMPMRSSYDLAERDYSDVAELYARIYEMDLEGYYVREGGATPAVAMAPTTPHHKHKGHHQEPGHKRLHSHVTKEPTTPSPDTATSKLSAREPKGGRGRGGKGRKGRGRKGKGRKGRGGTPPTDATTAPSDASPAEAPTERDIADTDDMLFARDKGGQRTPSISDLKRIADQHRVATPSTGSRAKMSPSTLLSPATIASNYFLVTTSPSLT